jgi:signal transduction histidine kinase
METGQRGYLLTSNPDYLDRYNRAKDVVPQRLSALLGLLQPYPDLNSSGGDLKATVDAKLTELAETISLKAAGKDADALAIVNTNAGKAAMDRATDFLQKIVTNADQRLTAGVADQRANANWLRLISIVGGLLIIGVVGGSAIIVLRYTRELAEARDEVSALNVDLEQRVQDRTAALTQANDEIQRFAYIVTHDLRAPLVNIMGFTSELETSVQSLQALVDKVPDDEDAVTREARLAATEDLPEAIGFIRSSTRKMDALINAILKLSREGRRTLKAEPVDLNEVIGNAAAAVQHQVAEADGTVAIKVNTPTLVTDRLSIEQLFGNLLDNAVKYRAKERPLRVEVTGGALPGGRVRVDIKDNGRGIAEQDRERVFELFRRSGVQDQPGEGIGLAYVRTVVRGLGGDITVSSTFGEGTTFHIVLPRQLPNKGSAPA